MSLLIDVIILAIIALCIFFGYKKGLVGVVLKILSFFIAIILTLVLFKPVTNLVINNTTIDETIENAIYSKLEGRELTVENAEILKEQDIPESVIDNIIKYINEASKNSEVDIAKSISQQLAKSILNVLVAIVLFIVIKLILLLARAIADKIAELPIIKQFNKLGGVIYGTVKGFLIVYLILALASLIIPMINNADILDALNKSYIGSAMYNNNLILKILF